MIWHRSAEEPTILLPGTFSPLAGSMIVDYGLETTTKGNREGRKDVANTFLATMHYYGNLVSDNSGEPIEAALVKRDVQIGDQTTIAKQSVLILPVALANSSPWLGVLRFPLIADTYAEAYPRMSPQAKAIQQDPSRFHRNALTSYERVGVFFNMNTKGITAVGEAIIGISSKEDGITFDVILVPDHNGEFILPSGHGITFSAACLQTYLEQSKPELLGLKVTKVSSPKSNDSNKGPKGIISRRTRFTLTPR